MALNTSYPVPVPCRHRAKRKTRGLCANCYGIWLHKVNPEYHQRQKSFQDRWYIKNWQKIHDYSRKRNRTIPKWKRRDAHLRWKMDITLREFNRFVRHQKNRCKVCGKLLRRGDSKPHGDHSHLTGKFRGVLCGNCNRGLGSFLDNIHLLRRAIRYLQTAEKEADKLLRRWRK